MGCDTMDSLNSFDLWTIERYAKHCSIADNIYSIVSPLYLHHPEHHTSNMSSSRDGSPDATLRHNYNSEEPEQHGEVEETEYQPSVQVRYALRYSSPALALLIIDIARLMTLSPKNLDLKKRTAIVCIATCMPATRRPG